MERPGAEVIILPVSASCGDPLEMRAKTAPGVHEEVLRLVADLPAPAGKALDLGAGSGILSLQLHRLGYAVDAVDLTGKSFGCREARFREMDLNADFAEALGGSYALITAVEVIEHLQNPWHFLGECAKLLASDGVLILTTPNIESSLSRLKFMAKGEFMYFSEAEFLSTGHITPLTVAQIRRAAEACGLTLVKRTYNRVTRALSGRISSYAARCCVALINRIAAGFTKGEIHVFVLAKIREDR